MPEQRTLFERAFALARSGEYENPSKVAAQLHREGYADVRLHFDGLYLWDQVRMMIAAARDQSTE